MAASEIFISHIRRLFPKTPPFKTRDLGFNPPCPLHSCSKFLNFNPSIFLNSHYFCSSTPSDSQPQTPPESPPNLPPPSPPAIKPVSYNVKPIDPSSTEELPIPQRDAGKPVFRPPESRPEPAAAETRQWTREDIRYVKDVPSISPVSYPTRTAPLPEDRVGEEKPVEDERKRVQLDQEARRIRTELRFRRDLKIEEENLPFPTIIKPEKKKSKAVLDLQEAIREVKANAKRNFIETVEAHVNLGVDPRRGDQMVRGATTLPHGTGKIVRVAVFAEGLAADEARAAGADVVGGDELIEEIKNGGGKLSFDKCISTPTFMPRLGKIARILGPRGLMPNPKLGSVTSDVAVAVQEAKRGRIDFKIDKTAIMHAGLGKVNFSEDALRENIGAFVNAILLAKPAGLKKTSKYAGYMNSFTLSSTMGPGFPVSIQSLSIAADEYAKLKRK